MSSSMQVSSICFYIENIVAAVKIFFEQYVAEHLFAVQRELVPFVSILRRSLLLSSYCLKKM